MSSSWPATNGWKGAHRELGESVPRRRRVVAKAEWTTQGANPRLIITSLKLKLEQFRAAGRFTRISTPPAET